MNQIIQYKMQIKTQEKKKATTSITDTTCFMELIIGCRASAVRSAATEIYTKTVIKSF